MFWKTLNLKTEYIYIYISYFHSIEGFRIRLTLILESIFSLKNIFENTQKKKVFDKI